MDLLIESWLMRDLNRKPHNGFAKFNASGETDTQHSNHEIHEIQRK